MCIRDRDMLVSAQARLPLRLPGLRLPEAARLRPQRKTVPGCQAAAARLPEATCDRAAKLLQKANFSRTWELGKEFR